MRALFGECTPRAVDDRRHRVDVQRARRWQMRPYGTCARPASLVNVPSGKNTSDWPSSARRIRRRASRCRSPRWCRARNSEPISRSNQPTRGTCSASQLDHEREARRQHGLHHDSVEIAAVIGDQNARTRRQLVQAVDVDVETQRPETGACERADDAPAARQTRNQWRGDRGREEQQREDQQSVQTPKTTRGRSCLRGEDTRRLRNARRRSLPAAGRSVNCFRLC